MADDGNPVLDPLIGGAFKKEKTARSVRLGIDKNNILKKPRSSKAPTVFKPDVESKKTKKEDPLKEKRTSLMPFFLSVMKEKPGVKLTSPERRRVLNAVLEDQTLIQQSPDGMMSDYSPTQRLFQSIRTNINRVLTAKDDKKRKAMDEMDLDDLLAGLSMGGPSRPPKKTSTAAVGIAKELASKREKIAQQALARNQRYMKREELRNKLEALKASYGLDMDVDVIVQGMNESDMNQALNMDTDDLLNAFMTMKFGGKRSKSGKHSRRS